jgi:flagellar biosynthesis protein FlhF
MQIKRYRGTDMQEALHKVKQELGTDAIILSTRQVRGASGKFGLFGKPMLEVTAARDVEGIAEGNGGVPDPLAPPATRLSRLQAFLKGKTPVERSENVFMRQIMAKNRIETRQLLTPLQDDIQELKDILHAVGDAHRASLREEGDLHQMRAEMGEMRQMLNQLTAQSAGLREANYPENLVVLYQQMIFNGLEDKFARRLVEEALKNIPAKEMEDFAYVKIFLARMLMKIVRVTGGIRPEPQGQRIVALIGPTGVGKTTTVAKLASEQLIKHKRRVALITVDTFRIAAAEQLKVYARIMGVPIAVVNGKAELRQALESNAACEAIFIDTGGRSQRDELQMSELRKLFGGEERIEIALTLSATTKDSDQTDITRRFGELPVHSVLFTKLDESTTFGSLFNHSIRFKTPIGYLATGQKVPEDIEVASKERLVDLLLDISGA